MDRRDFLKTAGTAGIGSAFAAVKAITDPNIAEPNASGKAKGPKYPQLPRRKLGKTGVEVPCLAFGLGLTGKPKARTGRCC